MICAALGYCFNLKVEISFFLISLNALYVPWNAELGYFDTSKFYKLTKLKQLVIRGTDLGIVPDFRPLARMTSVTTLRIYADYPRNVRCDADFCWVWRLSHRLDEISPFDKQERKNKKSNYIGAKAKKILLCVKYNWKKYVFILSDVAFHFCFCSSILSPVFPLFYSFTQYPPVSHWSNRPLISGGDSSCSWVFCSCTGLALR